MVENEETWHSCSIMTTTLNRVALAFLVAALTYAVITIPIPAHATMLGPCDHLNSWSSLKLGSRDTNLSDIGPIAGLQQMISEPDLMHTLDSIGTYEFCVFDSPTRLLLIQWQMKHGVVASSIDAEAGIVGEKTLAVAKNYCANATNARGDIIMSGPIVTYTFYFPQRGGGFGSDAGLQLPKYTTRVADQALSAQLAYGPQGPQQCNDALIGNGRYSLDSRPECLFSPFDSYTLKRNGYTIEASTFPSYRLITSYHGITIENGVATVTFDKGALPFFDSASVSPLVRGAIERTLKQFPSITSVRIRVMQSNHSAPATILRTYDGSTSADGSTDVASKIASLLAQLKTLQDLLAKLQGGVTNIGQTSSSGLNCLALTRDLWIGKADSETNGEVSKLQQFLIKEGVYPEGVVSGYYGNLTAQAVVRWQKAHGMDFVTTKSGVGPMTRERMKVCGVW